MHEIMKFNKSRNRPPLSDNQLSTVFFFTFPNLRILKAHDEEEWQKFFTRGYQVIKDLEIV